MSALFVGRSTYDLGYVCTAFPVEDSKISATRFFSMAGGPALNAAIAFSALGGEATLWTVIGEGPFAAAAHQELAQYGVRLIDAAPSGPNALPVSSIVVNASTGSRTIVNQEPNPTPKAFAVSTFDGLARPTVVMSDGHFPTLAEPILKSARDAGAITVLDGGSWKPSSQSLLPHIDIAIVPHSFEVPGASSSASRMSAIERYGVRRVAITRGGQSILWRDGGREGEIQVPAVDVVDTLGAGDIFHGAFCRFFEASQDFVASLRRAAKVASASCAYWGTRGWIDASAPGYGDD